MRLDGLARMTTDIKSLAMSVLRRHGVVASQSQPLEAGEIGVRLAQTALAPCGSTDSAGCYSVGVIDGRERFIHPPKASEDWLEWLRKWEPKGERPH